jgi:subfamily B ATP-binding cassette protein MsbA
MINTDSTPAKFRYLLHYLAPYKKQILIATLALVLSSSILLTLPLALRTLVDSVFVTKDLTRLTWLSLGLLFLFGLQSVTIWTQAYLFAFIANRVIADLRMDVYNHLLTLPMNFFSNQRLGEIISRITNDITVIQIALTQTPTSILRQAIVFVGGLVILLWLDWRIVAMLLLFAPVLVVVARYLSRNLQALAAEVQDASAQLTATLENTLAGAREVKAFSREHAEQVRFARRTETRFAAQMRQNRARALLIAVISLLGFTSLLLLLWYGGRQVIAEHITPGEMVAIIIYMGIVITPIGEFAGHYANVQDALGATRRVYEMVHLTAEPLHHPQDCALPLVRALPPVRGHVHFKNVSFGYEAAQPVLQNINLSVDPGQMIAIVGVSGVGKTTLVNLLLRFYEVGAGRIEIDGHDISRVSLPDLRQQIGLIPQDTFLFGRSVRENIAYGRSTATESEIVAAAQAALAHDFIMALSDGYDTLVGDRGSKLSAGQRQRIAIARLLLKNPRILILDEATASLDPQAVRQVETALTRLRQGRTTFMITHRLDNTQAADCVIVLQEGTIVEQGAFDDLLAQRGVFYQMYNGQT